MLRRINWPQLSNIFLYLLNPHFASVRNLYAKIANVDSTKVASYSDANAWHTKCMTPSIICVGKQPRATVLYMRENVGFKYHPVSHGISLIDHELCEN